MLATGNMEVNIKINELSKSRPTPNQWKRFAVNTGDRTVSITVKQAPSARTRSEGLQPKQTEAQQLEAVVNALLTFGMM